MRGCVAIVLALLMLGPAGAAAGYQDGLTAFQNDNFKAAAEAWKEAAKGGEDATGNAAAQYGLGYLYQKGKGVPRNKQEAVKWYRKAVAQGHADAMFSLAQLYQEGEGLPKNHFRARRLYEQAASIRPHAEAEYALAEMHFKGLGVPQNYGEAINWFYKAAKHGHPAAKHVIAGMYKQGWGVDKSLEEAWFWYKLAEQHEPRVLKRYNKDFEPRPARQAVEEEMNKFQLKDARKLLERREGEVPGPDEFP